MIHIALQNLLQSGLTKPEIRYLAERIFLEAETAGPAALAHDLLSEVEHVAPSYRQTRVSLSATVRWQ